MKIVISGAGIAGPALAHWLIRDGHQVTIVERAAEFRVGGYVIDFWGLGYTLAERMGILPDVRAAGYIFKELRMVDGHGRPVGGFPTDVFQRLTGGRFTSLPRGDLASTIFRTVADRAELVFGTSIAAIAEHADGVRVTFEDGRSRDFDLVVGADGLHSRVRALAFGPQVQFEIELGYRVATFETTGYRPRDELVYVAHASPGRQLARIALRGDRTMFLFVFRNELIRHADPTNLDEKRAILREVFAGSGWETPQIMKEMETAGDIYYDRVSQIKMPAWSQGRVVLIGDAACAVSLLAGEGTGLAMTEAYVLAGELKRAGGDHRLAFGNYEQRLRTFIAGKQAAAVKFAASFVPKTALGVWFRNQATRVMRVPMIADRLIGWNMNITDDFDLPDYDFADMPAETRAQETASPPGTAAAR